MAEITKSLKETAGKITGGFGRGLSKLSSVFKSKKIEPDMSDMSGNMSNTQYLGSIYQLMVDSDEERRLEYEREQNLKEESDSEEQRQHQEIIKALTLRRVPKPKRVIRRERKAEKKAEVGKPTKKVEAPKKEVPKTEAPKKEVPKTEAPKKEVPKTEAPKKEVPKEKVTEKPKTAEPVKQTEKPPTKTAKPAKEPAPKAEPIKPAPKAEPVKPAPKAEPVKPSPKVPKIPGAKGVALAALIAAGLSSKAQANIMSQIESESNFRPRSEDLTYSSAERIYKKFGKKRFPTVESAEPYVNNPEKLANYAYAKTDGNSEPGDGWKYRGRGFLQHTGKNQYKEISKYTGIDVVNNPDLLNDPAVAAKAVPWFFLKYKNKKPEELDKISVVNSAVGFAGGKEEFKKREELSLKYQSELSTTSIPSNTQDVGNKIDNVSKENKDMKVKDKPAPVNVQQNTTNVSNTSESSTPSKVDDRPAHKRK
jgi:putative chitinase